MKFSWSPVALWNNFGKDQVRKILQTILTISPSSFLAKTTLQMSEHSVSPCILFLDSPENASVYCQICMKIFHIYLRKKVKKKIILSTQIGIKFITYARIFVKGNFLSGNWRWKQLLCCKLILIKILFTLLYEWMIPL